jgi:hypothetical protein
VSKKYQILVEAVIAQNEEQKKSFETSLSSQVFKDLTLNIHKVKLSPEAITNLQTQIKNAFKDIGFDLNAEKAKKAGEAAGKNIANGLKATVTQGYEDAASQMQARFSGVEDITGYFKNLGYQKVSVGKTFDVDGIKKYNVELSKIENGWQTVDKALVSINENEEHVITSTKSISRELVATKNATTELVTQTGIYKEKLEQSKITHADAFKNTNVQKYATELSKVIDEFGKGTKTAKDVDLATQKLNTSIRETESAFRTTQKASNNFFSGIKTAMSKIALWGIGTTLVYGALRNFKEAIQYVKDLNKELTNIQVVTGMSATSVKELAQDFNDLASEMGATTLEVSRGSLEWFRQGKTVEETSKLLKATLMLSKLGNMESAQATEYLTSTLNGFKLEAEDAVGVVDKLIALDNQYATSAGELAEALQRTANSAQQAGFSFNEIISYIATVSSVSRKSADSIGF